MARGFALGLLVTIGAVSIVVSGFQTPPGPPAAAMAATKIEKVKDNLYVQMSAGKTVDQAAAAYTVPAKYKGYVAAVDPSFGGATANLKIIYDELKK